MNQKKKCTVFVQYIIILLGSINIGTGLYFLIAKDNRALFFADYSGSANIELISCLISFLGVMLVIQGLYNIFVITIRNHRMLHLALVLEFLKGVIIVALAYLHKLPSAKIPVLYIGIAIIVLTIIAEIVLLKGRLAKDYLFLDKK